MQIQSRRLLSAVAALLVVAAPMRSAGTAVTDVTDVVVVEIPVQVLRDGRPVRGLTAGDFEVQDRGKRREIVGFNVVDLAELDGGASPLEDVPISARRHFLLLFDIALTNPGLILRARAAAERLIAQALHPTDLVAVGVYSVSGAQILLSFTPDREQARAAIRTLGMSELIFRAPDPLGIVLTAQPTPSGSFTSAVPAGAGGLNVDAELRQLLGGIEDLSNTAAYRASVLGLASAMTELAQMINSVRGRKHVVFFSQGFQSSVAFGAGVDSFAGRETHRQSAESAMAGRYWEVKSDRRWGETHVLTNLELMTKEFVRAGATVQTVNVAGLSQGTSADDGLFMMADRTGGEYYRNYNDLGTAMERMLARTSVTYVLAIQPKKLKSDGSYRRLKVKIKDGPRGAELHYRPGYFAPSPFQDQSAVEQRLMLAELVLSEYEGGPIEASVQARRLAAARDGVGVEVTVEIDGPSLFAGRDRGTQAAEVYVYAIDTAGVVQGFFHRSVRFDLDDLDLDRQAGSFEISGRLDLPYGEHAIRTMVLNPSSGETGVRTTRISLAPTE